MHAYQHRDRAPTQESDTRPIQKIAIIVAMPEEATPIVAQLNLTSFESTLESRLNLNTYKGQVNGKEIYLIVNGKDPRTGVAKVGTDFATLCSFEVINKIKPDTIISAGTAGGYANQGTLIGDIFIAANHFVYHDRRIPIDQNYDDYSKGYYPCLDAPTMAKHLQLKSGTITTGNSLSLTDLDQENIEASGAVAKEMEAAAIANVANLFDVRMMAVKAITNLAGVKANVAEEFEKNFKLATENLANTLPKVLRYMIGKTPEDLKTPIHLTQKASVVNQLVHADVKSTLRIVANSNIIHSRH